MKIQKNSCINHQNGCKYIVQFWCISLLLLLYFSSNVFTSPVSPSSPINSKQFTSLPWRHLNYNETVAYLHGLRASYPHLVTLLSIGKSVHGRELLVIRLSSPPETPPSLTAKKERQINSTSEPKVDHLASALQYYLHNRTSLRPTVRLVGMVHGDEPLGKHLLLALAEHLLNSYSDKNGGRQNSRAGHLLSATDIELLPLANPDGFEEAAVEGDCNGVRRRVGWNGRENAHRKDLEENFIAPDRFEPTSGGEKSASKSPNPALEPETLALMTWAVANPSVVLAGSLHTGSLVVSYPLDGQAAITADDALFRKLSTNYVLNYGNSSAFVRGCTPNEDFNDGTVIGSRWKVIKNSMADFTYLNTNALELNLYLSCCKYPNGSVLQKEWETNRESLLQFIESAHIGIKGLVVDSATKSPIKGAKVTIEGNSHSVTTSEEGEYWRLLLPGTVQVTISAYGYKNATRTVKVLEPKRPFSPAMEVNFELTADSKEGSHETEGEALADFPEFHTPTEFVHHNYLAMEKVLKGLAARFPAITRLYSAGRSVEGRELYVLEISDNPGIHEVLEPEFKYVANMHGNEVVGREMVLLMAKLLLENYGHDRKITALVNSTRLHLMASMNPDGWERSRLGDCDSLVGRGNAHGVDLNRNFPDQYRTYEENAVQEAETAAIIDWLRSVPFVLSANLHGGSLVANYPFDGNNHTDHSDGYSATPDDALFRHLAKVYANSHPTMHLGECQEKCSKEFNLLNEHFPGGIINGAQWYALYGGMQDWNYLHTNCLEITVEMGCRKYPKAEKLPSLWRDHRRPLLRFLDEVHKGVKGVIRDRATNMSLSGVAITVNGGGGRAVHSVAPYGDYWRILLPGSYEVTASRVGYKSVTKKVVIPEEGKTEMGDKEIKWPVVLLDFTLERQSLSEAGLVASSGGGLVLPLLSLLILIIVLLFIIVACCPASVSQQFLLTGGSIRRKRRSSGVVSAFLSFLCCCGLLSGVAGAAGSGIGGDNGTSSSGSGASSTSSSNKPVLDSFHYTKLNASDAAPLFESEDDDDDEEELHFDLNSLLRK